MRCLQRKAFIISLLVWHVYCTTLSGSFRNCSKAGVSCWFLLLSLSPRVCGLLYSHAPRPIIPIVMCTLWSLLYDSSLPWGFLAAEILTPALRWRWWHTRQRCSVLCGYLLWINDSHFDHDLNLVTLQATRQHRGPVFIINLFLTF